MPVVRIAALSPPDPDAVHRCLEAVVDGLAAALGCAPAGVWASWTPVSAQHTGHQRRVFQGHCPTVTVLAMPGRPLPQRQAGLAAVAWAVASSLELPVEDVWVHWRELEEGLVFAGGALRVGKSR